MRTESYRNAVERVRDVWGNAFDMMGPTIRRALIAEAILNQGIGMYHAADHATIYEVMAQDYGQMVEEVSR